MKITQEHIDKFKNMSLLTKFREDRNWTQEELSEKSGISVRTIQRIEAGTEPKGYTLKALAKAIGVSESDFNPKPASEPFNKKQIKIINLSTLFFVLPPLNIIVPWTLLYLKKENNFITRQIVSLQILWTILTIVLVMLSAFAKNWLFEELTLLVILLCLLINLTLVIANAISLDRKEKLVLILPFSFL